MATTATPRRGAAADRLQHVELMLQVEARGRLVEQQHARPCAASPQASCTSTRAKCARCCSPPDSVGDDAVAERREIDVGQRALGELRRSARPPRSPAPMRDDLADREREGDMDMLCDSTARCSARSRGA